METNKITGRLQIFLSELDSIREQAILSNQVDLGWEMLDRWKRRLSDFLEENVSAEEAQAVRGPIDIFTDLGDEIDKCKMSLLALLRELESHREMVLKNRSTPPIADHLYPKTPTVEQKKIMPDQETRLSKYLRFFADHPLFSVLIVLAIIVGGLAAFTANLQNLWGLFSNKQDEQRKTLSVRIDVKNADVNEVEIQPLCEFYLTEDLGPTIHEYPRGRARLIPLDRPNDLGSYRLKGFEKKSYKMALPYVSDYAALLERGAANIHFVVSLSGTNTFGIGSIPFQKDFLSENIVTVRVNLPP